MKPAQVITQDKEQTIIQFGLDNQQQILIHQQTQAVLINRETWLKMQVEINDYFQVKSLKPQPGLRPLQHGKYRCNVGNCGGGECVHDYIQERCPSCNWQLVKVKTNGHIFCSNKYMCEYEK